MLHPKNLGVKEENIQPPHHKIGLLDQELKALKFRETQLFGSSCDENRRAASET